MKNKKKIILLAIAVLLFVIFLTVYYGIELLALIGIKPRVVEELVCSDVCNVDKDTKRVYQDVTDMEYCIRIGGKPYTYVGWGEFHTCLAE